MLRGHLRFVYWNNFVFVVFIHRRLWSQHQQNYAFIVCNFDSVQLQKFHCCKFGNNSIKECCIWKFPIVSCGKNFGRFRPSIIVGILQIEYTVKASAKTPSTQKSAELFFPGSILYGEKFITQCYWIALFSQLVIFREKILKTEDNSIFCESSGLVHSHDRKANCKAQHQTIFQNPPIEVKNSYFSLFRVCNLIG